MSREPKHLIYRPISVTFAQAASYTGIPERTLRDAQRRGELIACRYGGGRHKSRWIVMLVDLEAYVRSLRVSTSEGERGGHD